VTNWSLGYLDGSFCTKYATSFTMAIPVGAPVVGYTFLCWPKNSEHVILLAPVKKTIALN